MISAGHVDLYQLTSCIPHWDAGLGHAPVVMSFFARRLPEGDDGQPTRGYLLWAGLRRCLDWLARARFDTELLTTISDHPVLGPAVRARPDFARALLEWRFRGEVHAPAEGEVILAGPAIDLDGKPLLINGVRPSAQTPFLLVETDLLSAKLIETPLLSIINHMTMVASKASQVVAAAGTRPVLEFGSRRTHPEAAVDAAYAAYLAGCAGTSNVEAHRRYGVPMLGTMDHFAVQAWERAGVPRHETEQAFFRAFYEAFPQNALLLVDTYDTFGEHTGIRAAVAATDGRLRGIRLDSAITVENIHRARALLDALGAPQALISASGGMDEHTIRALEGAPVDSFGVGERIVTSPDAPVGVGAVGKLCEINGRPTMKLARGTGKATLPGRVQVFRGKDGRDIVACAEEALPGRPLLQPVWQGEAALPLPTLAESRAYAQAAVAALPVEARSPRFVEVTVSRGLAARVRDLVEGAVDP